MTMYLCATASRAATLLAKNPALFCRVMLSKLNSARQLPALPAQRRINNVVFEYNLSYYRGTAPMYFGSYAPLVIAAMKKHLRPGDVFLDVGANIGYLSAVAAGLVGVQGQVHAFEPVPAYFDRLERLAELNPQHSIVVNSCGAGEASGQCTIYVTREPGQNTMVPSYKKTVDIESTLQVPVIRLDTYIAARHIPRAALIKIDAEGFELPILRGLQGYFESNAHRPAIICEIAPRAYALMGKRLSDLSDYMSSCGYTAYDMIDGATQVDIRKMKHVDDVLFLANANS
jgi:FkbM family methyltransferase